MQNFILKNFFVDDGIVSSQSKAKLMELAENLPRAFDNYSFKVRHMILSFAESAGVTLSDSMERFFGVLWNFSSDQFLPALDVWLCKKTRGQHTDSQLSSEMISSCTFTSQNCWKFT